MKTIFAVDAEYFDTQWARIMHIAALLEGPAYGTVTTSINRVRDNKDDPSQWPWKTADEFFQALEHTYVVIDARSSARDTLDTFQQKEKQLFQDWSARFFQLLDKAEYGPEMRVSLLRKRINKELRDMVTGCTGRPADDDFNGWVELLRELGRNIQERDHLV